MQEQLAIQRVLRRNLLEAQSKNPRFSLRSYSKKVGIHYGALSAIMNGKRNVSREMAQRILRQLMLDPIQRAEILAHFPDYRPHLPADCDRQIKIEASEFRLICEWEHYAVLSLTKCKGSKNDPEWIAERLGITVTRAQEVLKRILDLGFARVREDGSLERVHAVIRSSDDTVDMSVRKSHEEGLDLARESLHGNDISERDFSSITMPINPEKLTDAKELIRRFQDELYNLMSEGEITEVYRLAIQLFPLTKLKNKFINKDIQ